MNMLAGSTSDAATWKNKTVFVTLIIGLKQQPLDNVENLKLM